MEHSLLEQISTDQIDAGRFVSRTLPQRTGNAQPIAYGGCTTSVAVHAACQTVGSAFHVYSILGTFLGPAKIDRNIYCDVEAVRDTRTFATRRVMAFQKQDDGSSRACAQCIVDFHVKENALLTYSERPPEQYNSEPFDDEYTMSSQQILDSAVNAGQITDSAAANYRSFFSLMDMHVDVRYCIEGVGAQNVLGICKSLETRQDHHPIYEKSTGEWIRTKNAMVTIGDNVAALAFLLDGGLSFLPLQFNHMDFNDSSACSTLDFALRIMTPVIDVNDWHLRERKTVAASGGRTYSESRLWNRNGDLVAVMSQTCILRPPVLKEDKVYTKL